MWLRAKRDEKMSLEISAQMRQWIFGRDPRAITWLEDKLRSGKGSVAALMILRSLNGQESHDLVDFRQCYGFCGNTMQWQSIQFMISDFKNKESEELDQINSYFTTQKNNYIRVGSIPDLSNSDTVERKFKQASDSSDFGKMYLLLENAPSNYGTFWSYFSHVKSDPANSQQLKISFDVFDQDKDGSLGVAWFEYRFQNSTNNIQ